MINRINMGTAFQSQLDYSSLLETANFSAVGTLLSDWMESNENIISRGKDSRKRKRKMWQSESNILWPTNKPSSHLIRTFQGTWLWGRYCGFGEGSIAPVISTRFLPRCNVSHILTSIRYWWFFWWQNVCPSHLAFPTLKVLGLHPLTSNMIKRQGQGAQGGRQRPRIGHGNPDSNHTPLSILNIAARSFLYKSIAECMSRPPRSTLGTPSAGRRKTTLCAFIQAWDFQIRLLWLSSHGPYTPLPS